MPDVSNPPGLTESGDVDHDETSNRTHDGDDLSPATLEAAASLSILDSNTDPTSNGEFRRKGGDVVVRTGSATTNLTEVKGSILAQAQNTNELVSELGKTQFNVGLTQLDYPTGDFDVFANGDDIATNTTTKTTFGAGGTATLTDQISQNSTGFDNTHNVETDWWVDIDDDRVYAIDNKTTLRAYSADGSEEWNITPPNSNGDFSTVKSLYGNRSDILFVGMSAAADNQALFLDKSDGSILNTGSSGEIRGEVIYDDEYDSLIALDYSSSGGNNIVRIDTDPTTAYPVGQTYSLADSGGIKSAAKGPDNIYILTRNTNGDAVVISFIREEAPQLESNWEAANGSQGEAICYYNGTVYQLSEANDVYAYDKSTGNRTTTSISTQYPTANFFDFPVDDNGIGYAFTFAGNPDYITYIEAIDFDNSNIKYTKQVDYAEDGQEWLSGSLVGDKLIGITYPKDGDSRYAVIDKSDGSVILADVLFNLDSAGQYYINTVANNGIEYGVFAGNDRIETIAIDSADGLSGTLEYKQKDLGITPKSAVLNDSATDITANNDIQYTITDGDGNTKTVTRSDLDTEIDVSNFTSNQISVQVDLSRTSTSDTKPVLEEWALYTNGS